MFDITLENKKILDDNWHHRGDGQNLTAKIINVAELSRMDVPIMTNTSDGTTKNSKRFMPRKNIALRKKGAGAESAKEDVKFHGRTNMSENRPLSDSTDSILHEELSEDDDKSETVTLIGDEIQDERPIYQSSIRQVKDIVEGGYLEIVVHTIYSFVQMNFIMSASIGQRHRETTLIGRFLYHSVYAVGWDALTHMKNKSVVAFMFGVAQWILRQHRDIMLLRE
ncbi:hypothetical protein BDQ17DRAFT_1338104 [Cyathus striatus]|nr:hypothetical protein BDQ17DRAFT_1338104 [Cyathus striatus]